MTSRPQPRLRQDFKYFHPLQTRWGDNDQYGHVNNAIYYQFFDLIVNNFQQLEAGWKPLLSNEIALVVETKCNLFAEIAYPSHLEGGLVIAHTSRSSLTYHLAIFKVGEDISVAHGHFVQVWVDKATRKPCEIPDYMQKLFPAFKA